MNRRTARSGAGKHAKKRQDDYRNETTGSVVGRYFADRGVRETIESIVVAVILALLFRAFEAEAFVIPTGSMAPTLMGRHKDVECDKCGYRYRAGDSQGPEEPGLGVASVVATTCPICRYQMTMQPEENANQESFSGDRILVDKFAYAWNDPERWDVIVFKYPGNPKQNYIKRLIGLPGETIRIMFGDIYTATEGGQDFRIQSKPPRKLLAMLQLVDDSHFVAPELREVDWPSRWQEWTSPVEERRWQINTEDNEAPTFTIETDDESPSWLRYKHLVPHPLEWDLDLLHGHLPERVEDFAGELISDYYPYNDGIKAGDLQRYQRTRREQREELGEFDFSDEEREALLRNWSRQLNQGLRQGIHWVGDLAMECDVEVDSSEGTLLLDLVEGGVHFTCAIDLTNGEATIKASDPQILFVGDDGNSLAELQGLTEVNGAGTYRLRFANCDNRIYLWINNQVVDLNGRGDYQRPGQVLPTWSPEDPGDALPAGIGVAQNAIRVTRCRLYRDVYYTQGNSDGLDYSIVKFRQEDGRGRPVDAATIREVLQSPQTWDISARPLFESLYEATRVFPLAEDQFLPLGDNSPASQDARSWPWYETFVEDGALIGKAVFVYWPHSWNRPVPYWPNFQRMGFIR